MSIESTARDPRDSPSPVRKLIHDVLAVAIEAGVLVLVVATPWAFGSVEPELEFLAATGVAILVALWAMRVVVAGKLSWARCPVILCIAGFFLFGMLQLVPAPDGLLRGLSPSTADLYDKLLPSEPEVLPTGERAGLPRRTLSLYPAATRHELVQVLALLLLFVLVRNNIASAASLRRLSIVALANGCMLAYLGLAQAFSSPPNMLYWTFESPGRAFGPFINRNHFAFYMNLSIGLGIGLLLYTYSKTTERGRGKQRSSRDRGSSRVDREMKLGRSRTRRGFTFAELRTSLSDSLARLMSDLWGNPRVLWISAALALMITSTVFCLSRGGFLALLVAAFVCVTIRLRTSPQFLRLEAALFALTMAVGLLIWFGLDEIEKRIGSIWTGEALEESRADLWRDGLLAAAQFPFLGSGYGTFQDIEPLHRTEIQYVLNQYAHNEYLEALVEGGVLRLALTLLAIGLVFRLGYRAVRRHEHSSVGGLALGAVAAWTTLVAHSFGEFGVHVPAIAILGTVVGAQLCGLATSKTGRDSHRRDRAPADVLNLTGLVPIAAAVVFLFMGWALVAQEWLQAKVQLYRRAADRAINAERPDRDGQLMYLTDAVNLAPDFARLQVELARAHLDAYEAETDALEEREDVEERDFEDDFARVERQHLIPALRHYLDARAACVLLGQSHVRIAAQIDAFEKAEPRTAYLDRAKLLVPWDPELWYICGIQELLDEQQEQAWSSWRRSLDLAPAYFQEIVDGSLVALGPDGVLERVLPDNAEVILQAAQHIFPNEDQRAQRRPFLARAAQLMNSQPADRLTAEDLYVKALVHEALEQWAEAEAAFRSALSRQPAEVEWRCDFAEMLYGRGRIDDAHREVVMVLRQQPQHTRASQLYAEVSRIRAER